MAHDRNPGNARHHQDVSRRQGAERRQSRRRGGRDPRHLRRERRRQVDADEGAERRLSARHLRGRDRLQGRGAPLHRTSATASVVGIIIIHQELALVPHALDRREHLPRQRDRRTSGVIDWNEALPPHAASCCGRSASNESPDTLITNLGVGKQQLVEIAKALSKEVKLLILDEPTASLNETDSAALLEPAARVQGAGHHLDPDLAQAQRDRQVADTITVLRDGTTVETLDCRAERDQRGPHHQGHGRPRDDRPLSRRASATIGDELFEIDDWHVEHPLHAGREVIKGVDLNVRTRRGRRHRRADGRRPHRTGHERLRPLLRPQHQRDGDARRRASSTLDTIDKAIAHGHRLCDRGSQDATA